MDSLQVASHRGGFKCLANLRQELKWQAQAASAPIPFDLIECWMQRHARGPRRPLWCPTWFACDKR
jgi:hypothetical protein